jgi:hypothetical protein
MAPTSEDADPVGAAAPHDDSDGSGSDSDSSDADAFELSEQDVAAMQKLEEALKADPYSYDNHIKVPMLPMHAQLQHVVKNEKCKQTS